MGEARPGKPSTAVRSDEAPRIGAGLGRLITALLLAVGAEALSYFAPQTLTVEAIGMVIAAVAIGLSGLSVYRKGLVALRRDRLNINALMSVAVTGAYLIGQWSEAAMVMALFAIAELIEARSVDRARNAIKSLMALAPDDAEVKQADGSWLRVPAEAVPLEAVVRVKPGERVPLDGKVIAGHSAINQAPVTGESIPVDKEPGDPVFAGTINETGLLECRVTAVASNTTLARIIHAVEEAQNTRAPTQRFVDRFAAIYTPVIFVMALAVVLVGPWGFGWTWFDALYKALVLLVIACPCALVISTPVTVVSGLTAAARRGILIKAGPTSRPRARSRRLPSTRPGRSPRASHASWPSTSSPTTIRSSVPRALPRASRRTRTIRFRRPSRRGSTIPGRRSAVSARSQGAAFRVASATTFMRWATIA